MADMVINKVVYTPLFLESVHISHPKQQLPVNYISPGTPRTNRSLIKIPSWDHRETVICTECKGGQFQMCLFSDSFFL